MTDEERTDLLSSAGRILLENGGETYRAEDTVRRMAGAMHLADAQAFAVPSGLFLSYTNENGEKQTAITRIHKTGTRLDRVDEVNRISRALSEGTVSQEELPVRLKEIEHRGEGEPWWICPLMAMISAAGFAVTFGGTLVDMLVGGLCAALTQVFPLLLPRERRGGLSGVIFGGVECTLLPLLFSALTGLGHTEAMIAAAMMPLVPGLSMTSGMQDLLRGDMVSGVANVAGALLTAALLAGGSLVGSKLFRLLGLAAGPAQSPGLAQGLREIAFFVGASVGAGAFAAQMRVPKGTIPQSGLLGGLSYILYVLMTLFGLSSMMSMLCSATFASLGSQWMARRFHHVSSLYEAAAILPLVPGLGLYRAMQSVAEGAYREGVARAVEAMAFVLLISLGLAAGSALNAFWRDTRKKREKGSQSLVEGEKLHE